MRSRLGAQNALPAGQLVTRVTLGFGVTPDEYEVDTARAIGSWSRKVNATGRRGLERSSCDVQAVHGAYIEPNHALIAQLDRAFGYGPKGWGFEFL